MDPTPDPEAPQGTGPHDDASAWSGWSPPGGAHPPQVPTDPAQWPSSPPAGPPDAPPRAAPPVAPPVAPPPLDPPVFPAPPPHGGGSHRWRLPLAVLSAVALLVAGGFAVSSITAGDGSDSPEAAVAGLFDALEEEDLIGVVQSLPPGERAVFGDPLVDVVGELQRLDVLSDFDLAEVPGVDIEVDGLELSARELGPGVAVVSVDAGSLTATAFPSTLPIGEVLEDLGSDEVDDVRSSLSDSGTADLAEAGVEMVAIEEADGWHVSLLYTIAEAARDGNGPVPPFGDGLTPVGADTPDGAVDGLVRAAVDLDLAGVISMLPPDEMRVLYDYGPLFVDDADDVADELRDEGWEVEVRDLDLRVEGSGSTRQVVLEGVDMTVADDEGSVRVTVEDGCTVMEATDDFAVDGEDRIEVCEGDDPGAEEDDSELEVIAGLGVGTAGLQLEVVERDGRWYVSPARSLFAPMLSWLEGLERSDVEAFFEDMDGWFSGSSRFEAVGGPVDEEDLAAYDECSAPLDSLDYGSAPREQYEAWLEFEECLRDLGVDPGLMGYEDPCWAPYEDLDDDADESEWLAADAEVEACSVERFGRSYTDGPRALGDSVLVPSTSGVVRVDRASGEELGVADGCRSGQWLSPMPSPVAEAEVLRCGDETVGIDGSGAILWTRDDVEKGERNRVGPTAFARNIGWAVVVTDSRTGVDLWTVDSSSANVAVGADAVYISNSNEGISAFDLSSGEPRWTTPYPSSGLWVDAGGVFARTDEFSVPAHVVMRLDAATGAVTWASEADPVGLRWSDFVGSTEDILLLVPTRDDDLVAYDRSDGSHLWTRPAAAPGGAAIGGGRVAFVDEDCELVVLDERSGDEVASFDDSDCWSAPAIVDGSLVYLGWGEDGYEVMVVPLP